MLVTGLAQAILWRTTDVSRSRTQDGVAHSSRAAGCILGKLKDVPGTVHRWLQQSVPSSPAAWDVRGSDFCCSCSCSAAVRTQGVLSECVLNEQAPHLLIRALMCHDPHWMLSRCLALFV